MAGFEPVECPPDCYFGQTLDNLPCCGYFILTGNIRGCDPGPGCRRYRPATVKKCTRKAPKWDTEKGREMWLDKKSDGEIAKALGVTRTAVGFYRRNHWQKEEMAHG